ncbi:hypothetical protein O3M35_007304 [Rhynocoris fuscipes]|uniref:DM10 domain-containing protein n=1 Tax=Rhynocoris fuscipes TaxID=488301 RepID=A0AAW1D9L8_9HEMI
MEELPKLPGNSFPDLRRVNFKVPHTFDWYNGYPVMRDVCTGIGSQPLDIDSIAYAYDPESVSFDPSMIYGRTKSFIPPVFKPHFVLYDKKCLFFKGVYTQIVEKELRIRKVQLVYFLEDDTLTVSEPETLNAGYIQGKLVKRGRYPRDASGQLLHWKDLNVGLDLLLNGMNIHLYECDKFTREYLKSQGLEVNPNETCPPDPYTEKRRSMVQPKTHITSDVDAMKKMLMFEGKVLRFTALYDDLGREWEAKTKYNINYFLQDDTVEIIEIRGRNSGSEGRPKILKRTRVPQYFQAVKDTLPAYMEMTEDDVPVYLGPPDFVIGKTVNIFNRRYLIIDCDNFTRKYYETYYKILQPDPIKVEKKEEKLLSQPLPTYTGIGSPEDSIQSWYNIIPKAPKKDEVRLLVNMNKKLRYTAVLDWVHPEDEGREFIIGYRLSDGFIQIDELKKENSGHKGGGFLKPMLVQKPGTDRNNPEYLTPNDFVLGEVVPIFGHRFKITGVDLAVYRYMVANPEKFSEEAIADVRRHLVREGLLTEDIKDVAEYRRREEIAQPNIQDEGDTIEGFSALDVPIEKHPSEKAVCHVKQAGEAVVPLL